MKKGQLKALFIEAKGTGQKYIGVMIQTEGSSEPEVIINPKENFNAKFDYYMAAYDDDLILIAAKGKKDIRITGAAAGASFEDIQSQLIDEKASSGWKEQIADEFSCGSVPNRGAHYGKKYIERWIQRDKKNCKYVLKMDIRHFFESVDHDVLKAWLKKKIRDERMLYILELIIDGSEVGLPLGFYTSQWLSNFMLQPLDHFIKEQLKAVHYISDIRCVFA